MKLYLVILTLLVCLFSAGCGSSGPTLPPPATYTIGGTVSGLAGTGLVLQDNSGNNLTVSANATTFSFTTAITSGSGYKVTVLTQPSSPAQSCAVTGGSGTATANITNVSVTCTNTIGGTISGLTGTGLVLQDNGGNNLTVSANATTFTFTTALATGASYAVTVLTQPSSPTQNCVVTSGSGTANGNVTSVSIACTTLYTIGGSISGLAGSGLVLQDNGGNNLTVSANATTFTFTTALNAGASYAVTVLTQPSTPTQNCVVTNGSGTASANVTTVNVACTTLYTIGGTISNLVGTGLVLQNNTLNNLTVSANATTFSFTTPIASGSAYSVTVLTQPTVPTQNCVVTSGTGTAGTATNISIACTTVTYTVGGTVSGLAGTGLVLQDNGGNNLSVTANGQFTFSAAVGQGLPYAVTVFAQPINLIQNCVVGGGSGTVTGPVTTVSVACTTTTYTIGGTVSGLVGSGLVLQDNGGSNQTILASTPSFSFPVLDAGATYNVTVLTQPSNPTQSCSVASGGGTANANVTLVVTCANINEWTWENGPDVDDQSGIYPPTVGTTGTTYVPGARYWGASWSDTSGNFWLFGGYGYDSAGNNADINDLWEYSGGEWTWVDGGDVSGAKGIYPATVGTAGPTYVPGARDSAASWTDASGNFWLFGGHGYDSAKNPGDLNDLWEYSTTGPNAGEWTWVSGSDTINQIGTYGTIGTGTTSTVPGARYNPVSWVDKNGNFWLFGGYGFDSTGAVGYLNDLWEGSFNSSNQWIWTWQGPVGSDVQGVKGAYGSKGTGGLSPETFPGARYLATSWTDTTGNLWLFGGYGLDSVNTVSEAVLSDLWEYNIGTGIWTWVGGPDTAAIQGTYGTMGMPASTNIPGSRKGAVAWTDSLGNFWLFGGVGIDSSNASGQLNDLWEYTPNLTNPILGEWTWQSGAEVINQLGVYGSLGVAATTNVPGARGSSASWIDSSGNLWLFGGNGPLSGVNGSFSDLWKYVP